MRQATETSSSLTRVIGLACLLSLTALLVAAVMQSDRGLWQDESTLLANFGLPLGAYFHALPFYDQAAPPFALLTLDAAYLVAHGSVTAMRLLVMAFHLTLLAGMAAIAWRRSDRAALLAIAMMAVTPLVVRYVVELKQYGFELQASLVFVLALRWWPDRPAPVMTLAAVLSFFSFSIMLVVGVGVLDAIVFRVEGRSRRQWLALLALYTLSWIACYLLLFRPATLLQTLNYPSAYQRPPLAVIMHKPQLAVWQFEVIGRAQAAFAAGTALAAAAVLGLLAVPFGRHRPALRDWAPWAEVWQPLRLFAGLMALVVLLWLANLYPVATNKQFLFTMPVGALIVAELFVAAAAAIDRGVLAAGALAAILAPSAANSLQREWTDATDFQDTQGLYAFLKSDPSALVLPEVLFEPTLRYYSTRDTRSPRRVSGWLRAETRPMESPQEAAAALSGTTAPVYQHVWQPLNVAQMYGTYADWLVRHARGQGRAYVAATLLGDANEALYARAAQRQGCGFGVGYRSRDVVALRIDCPREGASASSSTSSGKAQTARVL